MVVGRRRGDLVAAATVGPTLAGQSDKWYWDNLAGPDSSSFTALDQIKKTNVSQLEVAWTYPYAAAGFNPVVVDDVIYTSGRNGSLVALDAATGKELWIHEKLDGMTGRGINYWQSEDGKDKRLIFWINNFMQEIDARTGKSIMSFGTNGIVDLRAGVVRGEMMGWSPGSAGKVWKNLLVIGMTPGESFMSPPGDVRAFDVVTGKKVWQFHTVPEPGEFGYETWPKDAYKYAGGANNWGNLSIDEERGIVYVPTGSATYDFYGADRHGANLFANCLLALDARTGKRLWHFQTVHHDLWDLDNVSAPQLVTVRHNGRRVDAVAHAGKTGFLYVFDRVTGEPLWPIEERAVPASDAPGERAWPTQPFPTKPAPVRETVVHRGRCEPVAADAGAVPDHEGSRREGQKRDRSAGRVVHSAGCRRRFDLDAGQSGRIELWHHGGESAEGIRLRRQRESGGTPEARGRHEAAADRAERHGSGGARDLSGKLPGLPWRSAPGCRCGAVARRCWIAYGR